MHLLFDGRVLRPHFPGIGRYARCLLEGLVRIESRLRLTVLAEAGSERIALPGARWVEGPSLFDPRSQVYLPWIARRLGADLFHAPYYLYPYAMPFPVVVTIHDLIPLEYPEMIPGGWRSRLYGPLNYIAARRASRVITASDAARDALRRHLGLPDRKVEVVHYAPDPFFAADPSVAREPFFFSLISNKPHKNGARLIRSFAATEPATHGVRLRIAGPFDPDWPSFEEIAATCGVVDWVEVLGHLPDTLLRDLYRRCLAFIFPSFIEGFGLPILEAMACAAPVVVAEREPMRDLAGRAALTFDPFDEKALASTLERLVASPALRDALSEEAEERATAFSWERTASRTFAVYQTVVGSL